MRAEMVRLDMPRPEPWQGGDGASTMSPRPWQVGQVSFIVNAPPTEAARIPTPSQSGQTRGSVPARAPVPEQSGHGASDDSRSETVTPSIESANPIVAPGSMSAPRRGEGGVRGRPPPPPHMPPPRGGGACLRAPPPPPPTSPRRMSEKPPPPPRVRAPPPNTSLKSNGG